MWARASPLVLVWVGYDRHEEKLCPGQRTTKDLIESRGGLPFEA